MHQKGGGGGGGLVNPFSPNEGVNYRLWIVWGGFIIIFNKFSRAHNSLCFEATCIFEFQNLAAMLHGL